MGKFIAGSKEFRKNIYALKSYLKIISQNLYFLKSPRSHMPGKVKKTPEPYGRGTPAI
jgi:hypothetical protein